MDTSDERLLRDTREGSLSAARALLVRVKRSGDERLHDILVGVVLQRVEEMKQSLEQWKSMADELDVGGKVCVVLTDYGNRKIQSIKIIRKYFGLGLKDAKAIVDHLNLASTSVISRRFDREIAENFKREFDLVVGMDSTGSSRVRLTSPLYETAL